MFAKNFFNLQRFATIEGTAGNDELNAETVDTVIYGYGGHDTIYNNSYDNVTISGGDGNDSLRNGELITWYRAHDHDTVVDKNSISGGAGNDNIITVGKNSTVFGDDGHDFISSYWRNNFLNGGNGNDSITNEGTNTSIFGGAGEDKITSSGGNAYIDAGSEDDYITTSSAGVTVLGGAGKDTIYSSANNNGSILGGDGDDFISAYGNTSNLAIIGGAGSDSVSLTSSVAGYLQYSANEGDDIVYGFDDNDTLEIVSGSFSTLESGYDVVVQVDGGDYMTLKNAVNNSTFNLIGNYNANVDTNILTKTDETYTYKGGNKIIVSYTHTEKINITADFTGLGFNDTDFMLNFTSGSLSIQNSRDKVIDVAISNQTVAYAYLASGAGEINGGGISQLEVILGGNNSANTITAGSGGSSLWGGIGGNDILTGGAGQDTFFYGKGDGADIINNAGSSDIVNLYDVSLADITSANISGSQISVGFNAGSNLKINSSENLSATFKLADGSFKYNHSTNSWQNA